MGAQKLDEYHVTVTTPFQGVVCRPQASICCKALSTCGLGLSKFYVAVNYC